MLLLEHNTLLLVLRVTATLLLEHKCNQRVCVGGSNNAAAAVDSLHCAHLSVRGMQPTQQGMHQLTKKVKVEGLFTVAV